MIRIYGASDDLIEVDGDVREEFTPPFGDHTSNREPLCVIACSDGSAFTVKYDEHGCWRIAPLRFGTATYAKVEAVGDDADERADGTPGYSDVVTLTGDVQWVAVAHHHNFAKAELKRKAVGR